MTAQSKGNPTIANSKNGSVTGKRAYPGAILRYLGSVRDVTLAKTKTPGDGLSTKHQGP